MKRLVVCLDGTWNTADAKHPTNVVKLMRLLRTSARDAETGEPVPQVAFYDKGVGTGGPLDRLRGGAFGRGLGDNVRDGYRFVANNYERGDEIYLFGFSRGAFTARSLAGFIQDVGLVPKAELGTLMRLWKYYKAGRDSKERKRLERALADTLAGAFSRVPIECVGVWDTVGALGVPGKLGALLGRRRHQFHHVHLGPHIRVALHAVAIDEKRGPFRPALWDRVEEDPERPVADRVVEQVWFPGVHTDVGGGYPDAGLSDLALAWMLERVQATTGLAFDRELAADQVGGAWDGLLHDSLGWYVYSRLVPYLRLIGQNPLRDAGWRGWTDYRVGLSKDRQPYVNERIHHSAKERFGERAPAQDGRARYEPANLAAALAGDCPHPLPVAGEGGAP